jgi:hypothetical protein
MRKDLRAADRRAVRVDDHHRELGRGRDVERDRRIGVQRQPLHDRRDAAAGRDQRVRPGLQPLGAPARLSRGERGRTDRGDDAGRQELPVQVARQQLEAEPLMPGARDAHVERHACGQPDLERSARGMRPGRAPFGLAPAPDRHEARQLGLATGRELAALARDAAGLQQVHLEPRAERPRTDQQLGPGDRRAVGLEHAATDRAARAERQVAEVVLLALLAEDRHAVHGPEPRLGRRQRRDGLDGVQHEAPVGPRAGARELQRREQRLDPGRHAHDHHPAGALGALPQQVAAGVEQVRAQIRAEVRPRPGPAVAERRRHDERALDRLAGRIDDPAREAWLAVEDDLAEVDGLAPARRLLEAQARRPRGALGDAEHERVARPDAVELERARRIRLGTDAAEVQPGRVEPGRVEARGEHPRRIDREQRHGQPRAGPALAQHEPSLEAREVPTGHRGGRARVGGRRTLAARGAGLAGAPIAGRSRGGERGAAGTRGDRHARDGIRRRRGPGREQPERGGCHDGGGNGNGGFVAHASPSKGAPPGPVTASLAGARTGPGRSARSARSRRRSC